MKCQRPSLNVTARFVCGARKNASSTCGGGGVAQIPNVVDKHKRSADEKKSQSGLLNGIGSVLSFKQ